MYNKAVFIIFPWPGYSGVKLSALQINSAYDIVIKGMLFRMQYEKLKKVHQEHNYPEFDLSNTKTFFQFRNDALDKIAEPDARDYIMTCLAAIRDCDFSKKSVRDSFETLKPYFSTETENSRILKYALVDENSFINFSDIFKYAGQETIDEDSTIVKKIKRVIDLYRDRTPAIEK